MASLLEVHNYAHDDQTAVPLLVKRIAGAILLTTDAIITVEPAETANHTERVQWAKAVMVVPQGDINKAREWLPHFLANPVVQGHLAAETDPSDNDILFLLNQRLAAEFI